MIQEHGTVSHCSMPVSCSADVGINILKTECTGLTQAMRRSGSVNFTPLQPQLQPTLLPLDIQVQSTLLPPRKQTHPHSTLLPCES